MRARPVCAAPFLYGNEDQRRFPALKLPASPQTGLNTANPRIVNFHFAPQRLARQVDHSPPEFVQRKSLDCSSRL
jgi:hypothetical protein